MLQVRTPTQDDWQQINWLASNEVQEADHSNFESMWTKSRREFTGEKYESVVLRDNQVVGFCSVEKDESHEGFRAFIVLDWSTDDVTVQNAVFDQLEVLIRTSGTSRVWMRELAGDQTLINFMLLKGFQIQKRYTLGDTEFVNLERGET